MTSTSLYDALSNALRADAPVALATVVAIESSPATDTTSAATTSTATKSPATKSGTVNVGAKLLVRPDAQSIGTLGDQDLDRVVARDALGELESGLTVTRHYGRHGEAREREVDIFIECFARQPHMIIFGAVDFTAALVRAAKMLGFRVTVCDAREVFATSRRFPTADEVVCDWPDRYLATVDEKLGSRDAVCVLTHDTKFDVPAIVTALGTQVGYLGAMGSRRTHAKRVELLRELGVSDTALEQVMAPIGLDIGARTPEETAVAICAEIIARRTGRAAPSLRDGDGPIHRSSA